MGGKEPTYFLRARYLQAIQEAGGVPLVLPLVQGRAQQTFILRRLDGLLVTGSGSDLAPQILWRVDNNIPFQRMSEERAQLELGLSKLAFEHHVPTFGICGGYAIHECGLGWDVDSRYSRSDSQLGFSTCQKTSAEKTAHLVHIEPKTLLRRIIKKS